jgi:hypothetical protein
VCVCVVVVAQGPQADAARQGRCVCGCVCVAQGAQAEAAKQGWCVCAGGGECVCGEFTSVGVVVDRPALHPCLVPRG